MRDPYFDELSSLFQEHGFALYIVGGSVRDLLLGHDYVDHDFVTDATPDKIREFLPEADYTFCRFGSVRIRKEGHEIDITTLRKEGEYLDKRHPSSLEFVKEPKVDVLRRDFTINGLYLDREYRLLDYVGGKKDLEDKIIRFIGEPKKRIQEDPLRIIRAERFRDKLGFRIEEKTQKAIDELRPLLKELNPQKIEEERKKGWKGSL